MCKFKLLLKGEIITKNPDPSVYKKHHTEYKPVYLIIKIIIFFSNLY